MTGRRAVRQWDERLSRALQFRPGHVGGRIPSAQPVRRRGGAVRSASVGAVAEPTLPSWVEFDFDRSGAPVYDSFVKPSSPVVGDLVLVALVGNNAPVFTPAAGFTELASGAGTSLGYWVGWALYPTGYTSGDWEFTWNYDTGEQITVATWQWRDPGHARPTATATEVPSSTSVAYPDGGAFGLVACSSDGVTWTPQEQAYPYVEGDPFLSVNVDADLSVASLLVRDADLNPTPAPVAGAASHSSAREWLTLEFGWTA